MRLISINRIPARYWRIIFFFPAFKYAHLAPRDMFFFMAHFCDARCAALLPFCRDIAYFRSVLQADAAYTDSVFASAAAGLAMRL